MRLSGLALLKVLLALEWGKRHGITTFLADYSTPLGLLASETLVEQRENDDNFRVYSVKSQPVVKRRTYRVIPETGVEMVILAAHADYSYKLMPRKRYSAFFSTQLPIVLKEGSGLLKINFNLVCWRHGIYSIPLLICPF